MLQGGIMHDKIEHSASQNENKLATIAEVADHSGQLLSIVTNVATMANKSIPGPIKYAEQAAGYIAGIVKDSGDGMVEKVVCGTISVVAQGAAASPLISQAMSLGGKIPGHLAAKIGVTVAALYKAAPAIEAATAPVREAVSSICHNAFTAEELREALALVDKSESSNTISAQSPLLSSSIFGQLKSARATTDSLLKASTGNKTSYSASASILEAAAARMDAIAATKAVESSRSIALKNESHSANNLSSRIDALDRVNYASSSFNVSSSQEARNLRQACSSYFHSCSYKNLHQLGESNDIFPRPASNIDFGGRDSDGHARFFGDDCNSSNDCSSRGNCRPSI